MLGKRAYCSSTTPLQARQVSRRPLPARVPWTILDDEVPLSTLPLGWLHACRRYCIMGDGCNMEGISNEACSLAGHWGLGKLIALYDDNKISIDGHTDISFTEDVAKRYEALGWHVIYVINGNTDIEGLRKAIMEAKAVKDKPTLIKVSTLIGYGSPNKADTHDVHGAPLGPEETALTRKALKWEYPEFEVPTDVYDTFRQVRQATTSPTSSSSSMLL